MEQTALLLLIISLFLLVIIVGLLAFLVFRLFQKKPEDKSTSEKTINSSELHPEIIERMKTLENIKPKRSELFCPNHTEEPGETVCAICDKLFCKSCIKPFKSMHICKEHLPLLMKYNWVEALIIKTSTHDPEQGVRLYDFKKEIFQEKDIPAYIETHYKINVDMDYIETYLVLFVISDNLEEIKNLLPSDFETI
jgi:hypothetical protein